MSESTSQERSCSFCSRRESELLNSLKQCSRCRARFYCTIDCQKADWKTHRRTCAKVDPTPTAGSLTNPPHDDIVAHATSSVELLKALSHSKDFSSRLQSMPSSAAGLMHLCDFVARTLREYWFCLIPPAKVAEFSAELESFHGMEREGHLKDMMANFEEAKARDESFDKDAWPRFESEIYRDAICRNMMAAGIVLTPERQPMMGGSYDYSDEVKEICRRILPE